MSAINNDVAVAFPRPTVELYRQRSSTNKISHSLRWRKEHSPLDYRYIKTKNRRHRLSKESERSELHPDLWGYLAKTKYLAALYYCICGRPRGNRNIPSPTLIIYDAPVTFFTWLHLPGPLVFQRATLKNWEWPGYEARVYHCRRSPSLLVV